MKIKTALQKSKAHATFWAIILAILGGVVVFFPNPSGLVCVGLVALSLAMEVISIVYMTRKSRTDPDYLEEKIN